MLHYAVKILISFFHTKQRTNHIERFTKFLHTKQRPNLTKRFTKQKLLKSADNFKIKKEK